MASLLDEVYVLGGTTIQLEDQTNLLDSSEVLARYGREWTEGPPLPARLAGACAVAVSQTELLLIGGLTTDRPLSTVWLYSSLSKTWSTWPSLASARATHACIKTGRTVVVAGGGGVQMGAPTIFKTTEIIHLDTHEVRLAGDLKTPRFLFGIFDVGYRGQSIILTFGSNKAAELSVSTNGSVQINGLFVDPESIIQEWDPAKEAWHFSPAVLGPRHGFSAVSVEASLVCKPGQQDSATFLFLPFLSCSQCNITMFQPMSRPLWQVLSLDSARTGTSTPPALRL